MHEVFPRVPIILWPELWVRPVHGGHGVDKLPPDSLRLRLDQIGRNFITQLCLDKSSAWVLPTHHQAMSLPEPYRSSKLNVIHGGIDTQLAIPKEDISFQVRGVPIDRTVPVITLLIVI